MCLEQISVCFNCVQLAGRYTGHHYEIKSIQEKFYCIAYRAAHITQIVICTYFCS